MMAAWSKALLELSLTTARVWPRHVMRGQVPMVVFAGHYGFLHHLQLASRNLAAIWQEEELKNIHIHIHDFLLFL